MTREEIKATKGEPLRQDDVEQAVSGLKSCIKHHVEFFVCCPECLKDDMHALFGQYPHVADAFRHPSKTHL